MPIWSREQGEAPDLRETRRSVTTAVRQAVTTALRGLRVIESYVHLERQAENLTAPSSVAPS